MPIFANGLLADSLVNRLLSSLPTPTLHRVNEHLQMVNLEEDEELFAPGETITHVYFPETSVISLVREARGANVQLGPIGHEGFVGLSVFLGEEKAVARATVQVPGAATRMTAQAFTALSTDPGPFRRTMLSWTQTIMLQIAELTHCNSTHTVEERIARAVLLTRDRANADSFQLSVASLASTVRSFRPVVAQAVRELEELELIRVEAPFIHILDESGLEAVACECYRAIRWELDRMLRPY